MDEASLLQALSATLRASSPYVALAQRLGEVVRLPLPAAAWVTELLAADHGRPLLVIVPHETDALAWIEAVQLFTGHDHTVYFPAPSLSPFQEAEVSLLVRAEESLALDRIVRGEVRTVIATPRSLFRRLPTPQAFQRGVWQITPGDDLPLDGLAEHFTTWGFGRSDLVVEVGQFAVRGGVFDFFPPGETLPLRLDLFDDTVESIRQFEPESQRSLDFLETVWVRPLTLFPQDRAAMKRAGQVFARLAGSQLDEETQARLHDLQQGVGFPGWQQGLPLLADETRALPDFLDSPLVVALDPPALAAEVAHHQEVLHTESSSRRALGRLALPPERLEQDPEQVRSILTRADLRIGNLLVDSATALDFKARLTDTMQDQLQRFEREVETARARGDRVLLVVPEERRSALWDWLKSRDIPLGPHGVELLGGELQRGFQLPAIGLTLFGERQLWRRNPLGRRSTRSKRRWGAFLSSLRDLKIGDYVVHADHGIGQFLALRHLGSSPAQTPSLPPELARFASDTATTEVMEIAYGGGRTLLLPLSRLDQVQKYSGIEGIAPRLDLLGGTSWNRTKSRIKKGLRDMAAELLKLYAQRSLAQAPPMGTSNDLWGQFAAAFEYEETPDQQEAIAEIQQDLESERPMDRLLCGDVGFGKTEVAMRAAFRVVESGYQVAVLAPTTILADQHLTTFLRRFQGFPVKIDMISRFRSPREVKEIQKQAAAGQLDILIGTHRLLNRNIRLPRLGLLIIDEEQRFGVAHKEKLKQLRQNVHVLAMSATPVPRTLQLSLAGVRDLSVIETPPRDRMAVETAILPFDSQLIREAVEFELERKGQVYYVYNRVETIERTASFLRELIPGLKITVGHGQLEESELAKRMHAFIAGEYDLLLATTIIENGIDIPNVNTMIVHRADRFGLSQLYQLRGRVGRSDQLAYCYLLVPADQVLTPEARKRLEAIREFTELGAGFRVAGRDLEIRGAGNLLGAEQSGHIAAVGIETYLKMLEESVAELRGESSPEAPPVTLDLPVLMAIPEDYVLDPNLRMEIYQRLAKGEDPEAEILAELRDRFGPPPASVATLIKVAALKRLAESLHVQSIAAKGQRLVLRLRQDSRIDPERLIAWVAQQPGASFSPAGALTLDQIDPDQVIETAHAVLETLALPVTLPAS